jgi:Peptidase MA superfamily
MVSRVARLLVSWITRHALPKVAQALVVALLALAWVRPAVADVPPPSAAQPAPAALPPRDVAVLVQPAAARLPPPPEDFTRLEAGWLVIEAPSSIRDRVDALASDARDFRAQLASDLGQPVLGDVLVRIARNPAQMAELSPTDAPPFAYASGMAYPSLHLILLSMQAPETWEAPDLKETLRHELAHLALDEAVSGHHVPRWFNEGLAIEESGEHALARFKTLWDATLSHSLLPLADLDRSFPSDRAQVGVAYAESADVVRFLMRNDDRARFGSLVERVRAGAAFDRALDDAYDTDVRKLEYEWREEVSHRYGLVPMLTGGGALWTIIAGLAAVAFVKRRRRSKAKLADWAREEAEMDAALLAARDRVTAEAPGAIEEDVPPYAKPGVPIIEHDGRWYTLH